MEHIHNQSNLAYNTHYILYFTLVEWFIILAQNLPTLMLVDVLALGHGGMIW